MAELAERRGFARDGDLTAFVMAEGPAGNDVPES